MHTIFIVGNLGRDPEMRYLPDGTAVTTFSVAADNRGTTAWFRVSAFGRLAETAHEYLAKGRSVAIVGNLTVDKKTGLPAVYTRQDGTTGVSLDVRASEIKFLSSGAANVREDFDDTSDSESDDIPF